MLSRRTQCTLSPCGRGWRRRRRVRGLSPLAELCEDVLHDLSATLEGIVVPVAGNPETFAYQGLVSRHIACRFCVLASIDLYDDPSLETDKVQNVILKWDLATKFGP